MQNEHRMFYLNLSKGESFSGFAFENTGFHPVAIVRWSRLAVCRHSAVLRTKGHDLLWFLSGEIGPTVLRARQS